jgi:hypothetical protein
MKYCPLCRAEYQEGRDRCASCGAELVASLDGEDVRMNPPRLLWKGRDHEEFEIVSAALFDAGIPARTERALGGLIGSITHRDSTIHLLATDMDRGLNVAAASLHSRTGATRKSRTQICYNCSSTCSSSLAVCPNCRAQLIVEPLKEAEPASTAAVPGAIKYCPLCDTEYDARFNLCTICGVGLVPEEMRGRPLSEKDRGDHLEVVWRGGDPVAVSRVVALLRENGIRHHVQGSSDHLVFELAMPRPKYLVRVFRGDLARVREILDGVQDSPFFGNEISSDFPEKSDSRVTSERQAWNPAAASIEVWSGGDAAFGKLLEDCLSENRIPYRSEGIAPGKLRYFVIPTDEPAAREIVREISEGTRQE